MDFDAKFVFTSLRRITYSCLFFSFLFLIIVILILAYLVTLAQSPYSFFLFFFNWISIFFKALIGNVLLFTCSSISFSTTRKIRKYYRCILKLHFSFLNCWANPYYYFTVGAMIPHGKWETGFAFLNNSFSKENGLQFCFCQYHQLYLKSLTSVTSFRVINAHLFV